MTSIPQFTLGLDLDGVVADYVYGLREVVAADRGVLPETLTLDVDWHFEVWGLSKLEWKSYHQSAVLDRRIFRTLPVIPGAVDALHRLRAAGASIRILTQRHSPDGLHHSVLEDTADWLQRNNIPFDDFMLVGDKAAVPCSLYLEDAPHQIDALVGAERSVLVFEQPWNRASISPRRVEVARGLLAHANGWPMAEQKIAQELELTVRRSA